MLYNARKPLESAVSIYPRFNPFEPMATATVPKAANLEAPPKKVKIQDFKCLGKLGQGGFGDVYKVQKKDSLKNQYYAIKTLLKEKLQSNHKRRKAMLERNLLYECRHVPRITKMFYAFEDKRAVHLVLTLYPRGDVFDFINDNKPLEGIQLKNFIKEMYSGMDYLHQKNILHRDLKPENVLIDRAGHIALADLGHALKLHPITKTAEGSYGSVPYSAPDLLRLRILGFEADMYALGCTIHFVATKICVYIFQTEENKKRKEYILQTKPYIDEGLPEDLQDLIKNLLQFYSKDRLKKENFKNHIYLKEVDWNTINEQSGIPPFPPQEEQNQDVVFDANQDFFIGAPQEFDEVLKDNKTYDELFLKKFYYDFNYDE